MKKRVLNIVALLMLSITVKAQDIHFSQFYETSILRNPSTIGMFTGDYKVGVAYRQQWSSISKPYQTGLVSAESRISVGKENVNDFVSFGVLAYYDKAGSVNLQSLTVYPAINYNKSLRGGDHPTYLSVGFTGGFIQRSFDPGKATFDEQYQNGRYDPANPTGENLPDPNFTQWDVGGGFSFSGITGANNNINYLVGAAGYHFSKPKYAFADKNISIDIRWNGNASLSVKVNETFSYQLHMNYMLQGTYNELIAGGLLAWNKASDSYADPAFSLMGGLFYRVGDAIIPTVKVRYMDYSFGVSYDVTLSKLTAASNLRGGLELTVFKNGLFQSPMFEKVERFVLTFTKYRNV